MYATIFISVVLYRQQGQ